MPLSASHTKIFQGFSLEADVPMKAHTSFRVGGPADLLARPETLDELKGLIAAAKANDIPVTVLGGGTNTLVSDLGIRGLVILLTALKAEPGCEELADGSVIVRALAGHRLNTLCRLAMDKGLSGLEWAAGIPGTLGGAVIMNAGSFGGDMAGIIQSITQLDPDTLETRKLNRNQLAFSYRSLRTENGIVLKATLRLKKGDKTRIKAAFEKNLAAKKSGQPVSRSSAGCFFKNPAPDTPAGKLIDQAGLKGFQVNGARVSQRHANFIINQDQATCKDILGLKKIIQDKVFEQFNIQLKAEVKAIGEPAH